MRVFRPVARHAACPLLAVLFAGALLAPRVACGEPVAVRYAEGVVHGFLVMRTIEGATLADGDLIQFARGDRVTSRLVFRFKDGSLQDETVVFSQRRNFRLLSDHLVQKGPAFPRPMDVTVEGSNRVTVRTTGDDGKEKVFAERLELPADLVNGLVPVVLKNTPRGGQPIVLSMVAAAPKPRLIKLRIMTAGAESFLIGGSSRRATRFVIKVDLGGIAELVAPLVGKQPPDSYVWISEGETPTFVKSEGSLYFGGPAVRIELASPVWP